MKRVMSYGIRLHPDDTTSTYLLIKKLEKESFDSVVVYKPQGETTVTGRKSYDDMDKKNNFFVIGIQTKQQLDMFDKMLLTLLVLIRHIEPTSMLFP